MRKIILFPLIMSLLFSIDGKVVFYDGTSIEGAINSVDTSSVFFIPLGLPLPEEILVDNIDTLKLDNGLLMIIASDVKQLYKKGEFITLDEEEFDELADGEYYEEEDEDRSNMEYFSFSAYGGVPVYLRPSLEGSTPMPNLGGGAQMPYYEAGPINISPGVRIMTLGFSGDSMDEIKAIQLAGHLNVDLTPILYFLPDNIYIGGVGGLSYQLGSGADYGGGIGIFVGGTMDYWFKDLPFAFRVFGDGHLIPHSNPESKTGFGNIGAALILVLKRNEK
jgi:hypothetical protein